MLYEGFLRKRLFLSFVCGIYRYISAMKRKQKKSFFQFSAKSVYFPNSFQ